MLDRVLSVRKFTSQGTAMPFLFSLTAITQILAFVFGIEKESGINASLHT